MAESSAGVNGAWSMYRQCAATSEYHKSRLERFTKASLALGIVGAFIGTISPALHFPATSIRARVLGIIGSFAVALAGICATQAVGDNREKNWVKCRGAGEGLKSSVYLFSASVPPFDGANRAEVLAQRIEKALKDTDGIELETVKVEKQPPGPLSVDGYIAQRVDDQIGYYDRKSREYRRKAQFWRLWSFIAAAIGACMGAVSAIYSLSPWIALLATATASLTAFVKNQRYSSLVGLYQTTMTRLQIAKDQWLDTGKSDTDRPERNTFIQHCEDTMALENGAWTSQWSQPTSPQQQQQQIR